MKVGHIWLKILLEDYYGNKLLLRISDAVNYNIGNLVLTPFQRIAVIDFNRWKYGYKYEEFYKIQSFNV